MADAATTAIANQFVNSFYQTFDTNRAGLSALYVSNGVGTILRAPSAKAQVQVRTRTC
jgi:predicted MPP superfamily phosphohydrolase